MPIVSFSLGSQDLISFYFLQKVSKINEATQNWDSESEVKTTLSSE